MQSTAWAAFKRAEGYKTLRYGLFEGEALTGGASLLDYSAQGSEGFVLCPEGPILPWDDPTQARAGLRLLARTVEQRAEEKGGLGLRIEPHLPPPPPVADTQLDARSRRSQPDPFASAGSDALRRGVSRSDAPERAATISGSPNGTASR